MHITFQIKSTKVGSDGKAPIYARITINGKRKEFSIKRSIEVSRWIKQAGVAKGSSEDARSLNTYINTVRLKLQEHERTLLEKRLPITVEAIVNAYLGVEEKTKTIVEVFEYHNQQMQTLIGKDYAPGTFERYCTALKHVKEFIQWQYGKDDLLVKNIDYGFITGLEHFLKTVRNCGHNTTIKYITNFKKVVRVCLGHGWLTLDPFINYKFRLREVKRDILTLEEIETIMQKQFPSQRLSEVRDIFIFCCFTGLAFADVKNLSKQHLYKGVDDDLWLKVHRKKTDTLSSIPLLPPALGILERYKNHPKATTVGRLLPVMSNQKMNDYLKEIVAICGINKNVSCHTARHSFATSVTLSNNVPLESVSKMLGHRSVVISQHYARTLDLKLSHDVAPLKEKLKNIAQYTN